MISLVTELKDGTSLESMTVGSEGFARLALFHGVSSTPTVSMCQIEGAFLRYQQIHYRIAADDSALGKLLHKYPSSLTKRRTVGRVQQHASDRAALRTLAVDLLDAVASCEWAHPRILSQMLAVRRPVWTVAIGRAGEDEADRARYGKISISTRKDWRRLPASAMTPSRTGNGSCSRKAVPMTQTSTGVAQRLCDSTQSSRQSIVHLFVERLSYRMAKPLRRKQRYLQQRQRIHIGDFS